MLIGNKVMLYFIAKSICFIVQCPY